MTKVTEGWVAPCSRRCALETEVRNGHGPLHGRLMPTSGCMDPWPSHAATSKMSRVRRKKAKQGPRADPSSSNRVWRGGTSALPALCAASPGTTRCRTARAGSSCAAEQAARGGARKQGHIDSRRPLNILISSLLDHGPWATELTLEHSPGNVYFSRRLTHDSQPKSSLDFAGAVAEACSKTMRLRRSVGQRKQSARNRSEAALGMAEGQRNSEASSP